MDKPLSTGNSFPAKVIKFSRLAFDCIPPGGTARFPGLPDRFRLKARSRQDCPNGRNVPKAAGQLAKKQSFGTGIGGNGDWKRFVAAPSTSSAIERCMCHGCVHTMHGPPASLLIPVTVGQLFLSQSSSAKESCPPPAERMFTCTTLMAGGRSNASGNCGSPSGGTPKEEK